MRGQMDGLRERYVCIYVPGMCFLYASYLRRQTGWGQQEVKGNSSGLWSISCSDRFGPSCWWGRAHSGDTNLIYISFQSYPFCRNYCCCVFYSKLRPTSARPFFFFFLFNGRDPQISPYEGPSIYKWHNPYSRFRLLVKTMLLCWGNQDARTNTSML